VQNILLDAGPLVATFSPTDVHRVEVENKLARLATTGCRLLTTWPCIVEASYLLAAPRRFELLKWVELGGVVVYPFEPSHLADIVGWMRRYTEADKTEMDFADATLYWLAVDTGVTSIMTLDRRDFARYRLPDGRSFEIV
jgi:predicted nucleic acid-binding protein